MDAIDKSTLFANRVAVIATMHQKEQVMAPILEQELNVKILVLHMNTDEFGTFTRDVKRPGDQCQTARLKAEQAMALTGQTLGFASEGTFGPHPMIPYLPYNREVVMLVDREHHLEIWGQAFSTTTNYSHTLVKNIEEAQAFAQKAGFPQHGLVVMANPDVVQATQMIKGISTEAQFVDVVTWMLSKFGHAHIETDMRAMYNPTRMKVIAEATQDLIKKVNQCCPQCNCPGFDVVEHIKGLPCRLCHFPTELTLISIYHCKRCKFRQEIRFPDKQETADPAQCRYCNP